MNKKSFPELSVESKLLYERLKMLAIGDAVSYQELGKLIGRNIQAEGRGNLTTTQRRLMIEDQIHLGVVRGVGVRRLEDATVVTSERAIKRISRAARRRRSELSNVDYPGLNKDLQRRHNVEMTQTGAVIFFAKSATAKQIGEKLTQAGIDGEMPIGRTLEFFSNK